MSHVDEKFDQTIYTDLNGGLNESWKKFTRPKYS